MLLDDDDQDDGDQDDSAGAAGEGALGEGAVAVAEAWHKVAARAWLKRNGGDKCTEEQKKARLQQIEATLQRSTRRRHVFERAVATEESAAAAQAEAEQARVAREEEREAAAAQVEHQVEGILGKRVEGGANQYRVKWLNYSSTHNSWEPASHLSGSEMLIAKFEEKYKTIKHAQVYASQYTATGRLRRKKKTKRKRS